MPLWKAAGVDGDGEEVLKDELKSREKGIKEDGTSGTKIQQKMEETVETKMR